MLTVKIIFLACSIAVCHCTFKFDVEESMKSFGVCDKNGDKAITFAEFKEFFSTGGINKIDLKRTISDEEYIANFNLIDVTSDNTLDSREWAIGHTLWMEFSSYDENKDEYLDEDELVMAFNAKDGPAGNDIAFVEFLARIINDLKLHYPDFVPAA